MSGDRRRPVRGEGFDDLARVLAKPMSRRRAFVVVSGTLLAGTVLRPRAARAAGITCPPQDEPTRTKKCEHPGGAAVCVEPDWNCCSSTKCAQACFPWRTCRNAGTATADCDDTPRLCTDPRGNNTANGDNSQSKFCSQPIQYNDGFCTEAHSAVRGWCCRPGETCDREQFGRCNCDGEDCGSLCCKRDEYCEKNWLSANECKKLCPDGQKRCGWECCTSNKHCGGGECECASPLVSCGTGCCKDTPRDPKIKRNILDEWLGTFGATSGAHGGGGQRRLFAAQAPGDLTPALQAIAAVNAQGGAAMTAFTDGHRDASFRRKVVASRAKPRPVQPGGGLDAGSATALNAMLDARSKAFALIAAAATALARSRAAGKRHPAQARTQLLASARFADKAARALKPVAGLSGQAVAALTAAGVMEVIVSPEDAGALQDTVRIGGVPADLTARLSALGLDNADLARVRAGLLHDAVAPDAVAGPVLLAPLAAELSGQQYRALSAALTHFAGAARRHPLARRRSR